MCRLFAGYKGYLLFEVASEKKAKIEKAKRRG